MTRTATTVRRWLKTPTGRIVRHDVALFVGTVAASGVLTPAAFKWDALLAVVITAGRRVVKVAAKQINGQLGG